MITSKLIIIQIPNKIITLGKPKQACTSKIFHKKIIKIFNKIWPATKFANNLIAKLKIREKKEIASIQIKIGIINKGMSFVKNKLKILILCKKRPYIKLVIK